MNRVKMESIPARYKVTFSPPLVCHGRLLTVVKVYVTTIITFAFLLPSYHYPKEKPTDMVAVSQTIMVPSRLLCTHAHYKNLQCYLMGSMRLEAVIYSTSYPALQGCCCWASSRGSIEWRGLVLQGILKSRRKILTWYWTFEWSCEKGRFFKNSRWFDIPTVKSTTQIWLTVELVLVNRSTPNSRSGYHSIISHSKVEESSCKATSNSFTIQSNCRHGLMGRKHDIETDYDISELLKDSRRHVTRIR